MKIAFVVERPTQFEVPLFRHAARNPEHRLLVVFTAAGAGLPPFDPELGRAVDWGFDLLAGYPHVTVPAEAPYRWLRARLASERPDLVIINGYTRKPYLLAALAARRLGLRTGLRIDSALFPGQQPRHLVLRRLLMGVVLPRLFDRFLTVGTLGLRYLERVGVAPGRRGLFPYPVDVEAFRPGPTAAADRAAVRRDLGVAEDARVVASLSKHGPREGPQDLLAAAERLADRRDLWFVLAGDGPDRGALEAGARGKGLDRVRFPGYMPYPTLPRFYAAIDLFVHCAREERWGVSVAEALAAGRPVVASERVGAAHDLLELGANGYRYPCGAVQQLATAVVAALDLDPARVHAASEHRLGLVAPAQVWQGLLAAARDAE